MFGFRVQPRLMKPLNTMAASATPIINPLWTGSGERRRCAASPEDREGDDEGYGVDQGSQRADPAVAKGAPDIGGSLTHPDGIPGTDQRQGVSKLWPASETSARLFQKYPATNSASTNATVRMIDQGTRCLWLLYRERVP